MSRHAQQERSEWEDQQEASIRARAAEQYRKDSLCLWSLIEESDASDDVKAILRRIAEAAGVDVWKDGTP